MIPSFSILVPMGINYLSAAPAAGDISGIVSQITAFVTAAITWLTSFATTIVSTPLLLIFVITAFVGLGVGLINRIIKM